MVRAFLALELSDEIRQRLKPVQDRLHTSQARMTFVEPENIHITVKFLGEVDDPLLPRVKDAVASVRVAPFTITVGKVTVNNPRRPFTVWGTVDDAGKSADLFRMVEKTLAPLGFPPEARPFTPHATIARIKSPDPSLFTVLSMLNDPGYGDCRIDGIKLKKSTLTSHGPVYEDLLEVKW
jgi:2'-5' RNA ligase